MFKHLRMKEVVDLVLLMHITVSYQPVDVNTTAAPKFKMVLKVCKVKTKITVYMMDAMDSEMKKVEKLLQPQTIQTLEIQGAR